MEDPLSLPFHQELEQILGACDPAQACPHMVTPSSYTSEA